jgi:hypothetical protein
MKLRNIAGGALVLGVIAGVWLSQYLPGLGTGNGVGIGQSGLEGTAVSVSGNAGGKLAGPELGEGVPAASTTPTGSAIPARRPLLVVIREHQYFLQQGEGEAMITLSSLIEAIAEHPGDEDGLKIRIERSDTARVTAELSLTEALEKAGIAKSAVFWTDRVEPNETKSSP